MKGCHGHCSRRHGSRSFSSSHQSPGGGGTGVDLRRRPGRRAIRDGADRRRRGGVGRHRRLQQRRQARHRSAESWYEAPRWTKRPIRTIPVSSGYVDSFSDLPLDVDGDGFIDVIQIGYFARRIVWMKNPGPAAAPWTENLIDAIGPTEFAFLVDLDNDGKPTTCCRSSPGPPGAADMVRASERHVGETRRQPREVTATASARATSTATSATTS